MKIPNSSDSIQIMPLNSILNYLFQLNQKPELTLKIINRPIGSFFISDNNNLYPENHNLKNFQIFNYSLLTLHRPVLHPAY